MLINHILEDYSNLSGGIRTVVKDLDYHLNLNNIVSKKYTSNAEIMDKDVILTKKSLHNGIWSYSNELKRKLPINKDSIYHIHGIWMYPQYFAMKSAYKNNIPCIITPHGMLEPWLWEQGKIKKELYFNLLLKKNFMNSNVLHAITPDEKENLYKMFRHKNIEVIPNLISYKEIDLNNIPYNPTEKYILFVGRLHQKKGIDLLIKSFASLKEKNFKLKIAGPNSEYKNTLLKLIEDLNISDKVEFLGMITGKEKLALYKNAWVFVAPSYSEVVGMVNLEAGILSTPVITTYETGLYREWNQNGGILIHPNISELTKSLKEAISWKEEERMQRGKNLRKFIINNYSWEKNINKWIELYKGLECKN